MVVSLKVVDIPPKVQHSKVRRAIAKGLRQANNNAKGRFKFKVWLWTGRGEGMAKLVVEDNDVIASRLQRLEQPVMISHRGKYHRLGFKTFSETRTEDDALLQKQLNALNDEDLSSDYEDTPRNDKDATMNFGNISCGAWDADGAYVNAWTTGHFVPESSPGSGSATVEEDHAILSAFSPVYRVDFKLYDVDYFVYDNTSQCLYIVTRVLPVLMMRKDSL